jgi:DNA-binding MarR family transcriptional regulator
MVKRRGVEEAAPAAASDGLRTHQIGQLLSFYYPMHYRIGIEIEAVMGQGQVSRKQAAMLWLIHSRAGREGWIRRKAIEARLSTWFEMSNSNVSKLLRELARPPLSLVALAESPSSGREKVVRLTQAGEAFVAGMIEASIGYLSRQLAHVSEDELRWGIGFLALSFGRPPTDEAEAGAAARIARPPRRIARLAESEAIDE